MTQAEREMVTRHLRKWNRIFYFMVGGLFASFMGIVLSTILAPTGASPQDLLGKVPLVGFAVFIAAMFASGLVVGRDWDRLLNSVRDSRY